MLLSTFVMKIYVQTRTLRLTVVLAHLCQGAFIFESMATLSLAVNLVTYFSGVMHFDIADSANQLTNFMGTTYIVTIIVATLADTYIGRFKAVLLVTSIEFLVRISCYCSVPFLHQTNLYLCRGLG